MTYTRRIACTGQLLRLLLVILVCALPVTAQAQQENRLRRIRIVPHNGFTTVKLFFQDPPDYRVSVLPGRVRLDVRGADSPSFKKFRSYADGRIAGVFCSGRYHGLSVTIPVREREPAVQAVSQADPRLLSLEIGPAVRTVRRPDIAAGREQILNGTEKFVREFQLPARAGLPFAPTDAKLLKGFLSGEEVKLFQRGEGLLYREQGNEAVEAFKFFLAKAPAVRALAWYRLGEALALLERTPEALAAFRQGEALWPGYLEQAPAIALSYAEIRAKSGDLAGGRKLLARLMDGFSGTVYAAPLLDRLAQMYERQGETAVAQAMYRTVVAHAAGSAAAARARVKLADHEMFTLSRDRYRALLDRYRAIYDAPGDIALRDEALFKVALLQALYGPAREALGAAVSYDTCYPRGIFSTVVKNMREELLLPSYRELYVARDHAGLARLALDNREYLARCFGDPDFVSRLAESFRSAGMLTRGIELFGYLVDRSWAAAAAPFMAARRVEDALTLGNLSLAESAAHDFLARFPGDARAGGVRERLGRIAFEKGDLRSVTAHLSFLAGAKKPEFPESDYYLGKALAAAGDERGAGRSLARFTAQAPAASPLLPDGYFTLGGVLASVKEYPASLAAYRQGAKLVSGERGDQFLYKMGELYLRLNMVRQAKEAWEQVAARGGGGTWVKLAGEALSDLKWRLKIAGELP